MRSLPALATVCFLLGCTTSPWSPHELAVREGDEALAVGEVEAALAHFERAFLLAPDDPAAWRGLALAQQRSGEADEALRWFVRLERGAPALLVAELRPVRCEALRAAVEARLAAEAWSAAARLAERSAAAATCREPGLEAMAVRAHWGEAQRLAAAGDATAAARQLDRTLALRPGHPGATLARVDQLRAEGRSDEGLRLLSEALALHPKDPELIERAVDLLAEP